MKWIFKLIKKSHFSLHFWKVSTFPKMGFALWHLSHTGHYPVVSFVLQDLFWMGHLFPPTCINEPWKHRTLYLHHFLVCADHSISGTHHKTDQFGDDLTQSSWHDNLSFFKVAQTLRVAYFFYFQHINLKNWLNWCLIFHPIIECRSL